MIPIHRQGERHLLPPPISEIFSARCRRRLLPVPGGFPGTRRLRRLAAGDFRKHRSACARAAEMPADECAEGI